MGMNLYNNRLRPGAKRCVGDVRLPEPASDGKLATSLDNKTKYTIDSRDKSIKISLIAGKKI